MVVCSEWNLLYPRFFLDSTSDVVMLINVDDYVVVDANNALLEQVKMTKQEVVGKTCFEATHGRSEPCATPDDVCPIRKMLKTGKPVTVEHTHFDKDGTPFYMEVYVSPVRDAEGKITQVLHICRDTTERKRNEVALRQSEEQFGQLFSSMPSGGGCL